MSKLKTALRDPLSELARMLNSFGHRYQIDRVFFDWIEMCALAISNSVDRGQYAAREARYMTIVGGYSKEEARMMAEMLSHLVLALERDFDSPLQKLLVKLELGSQGAKKRMGQYFTPFNVSYMMAKMTLAPADKLVAQIAEKGFLTMAEPACGAGGMVLAFAKALEDEGINFQKHLHVTAQDIDPGSVHMTYVQTALMGIPAVVIQGDTLRGTATAHWFTPFHVLYGWNRRLYHDATQPAEVAEITHQPDEAALETPPLAASPVKPFHNEPMPLPDKPVRPVALSKWKIRPDPLGPTLSLP